MTAVPAVLTALVQALTVAPALTGVRVNDGPWLTNPSDLDVVTIGASTDPRKPGVAFTETPAGLGSTGDRFDIQNVISCYRGEDDMAAARARADLILETIRKTLLTDHTLGVPLVAHARLHVSNYVQKWDKLVGCEVIIDFTIRVQTFSTP